jgi:hypothetical protein
LSFNSRFLQLHIIRSFPILPIDAVTSHLPFVILLFVPTLAFAATKTWTGLGADNKWSTANNWNGNAVPGTGDIIVFDGTGKKNALISTSAFLYPIGELRMGASNTGTIMVGKPILVTHNLSLSGGTLSCSGGSTISVEGSWQNGGGTFAAGTGSVVMSGTGTYGYTLKESSTFNNLTISDGLVGYWKFDEGAGTTAFDSSGYGNNGTLTSAASFSTSHPTTVFTNAGSITDDGTSNAITVPSKSSLDYVGNVDLTYSFWVFPIAATSFADIFKKGSSQPQFGLETGGFYFCKNGITCQFSTNIGGTDSTGTYPTLSTWSHIAVVKSGTATRLYINGSKVLDGQQLPVTFETYVSKTDPVQIGGSNARFDDFRVYTRALSNNEISTLAAGQLGTDSGTYTLGAALTVNGTLGLYSGTLDVSSNNYGITASGGLVGNAAFVPRSGTVTLNGTSSYMNFASGLYNLVITAAKSVILHGAAVITHALTINASSTLTLNGNTLTATNASISNTGTITSGTGVIKHASTLSVSPASGTLGSPLTFTLTDDNINTDGTTQQTAVVSDGQENITLTETTNSSGVFTGSIPTAYGTPAGNSGTFEFDPGSSCSAAATFTYTDNQDATDVTTASSTLSAPSSCTPATQTSGTTDSSSGGGGGGGGGRSVSVSIPTTTPFSNTTTTTATLTSSTPLTGNTVIDGTIKRLNARIEKMLAKNPNSVFAKAIQRRILELIARVKH